MATQITMHGKWEDNYDDPAHPIPSLSAIDVCGFRNEGGTDLVIVIASPLSMDERSRKRLLDKIERYLRFIRTSECEAEAGIATPENTSIIVELHPDSDSGVVDLIERSKSWVAENGANLKVLPLGASSMDAL